MRSIANSRFLWNLSKQILQNKCNNAAAASLPNVLFTERYYGNEKKSKDDCDDGDGDGKKGGGGPKQNLLKYPVIPLEETLERFLKSVEPYLTPEEMKEQKDITAEFQEKDGEKLQAILKKVAGEEKNWLASRWLKTAYMQYRDPVTVFSSPGMTFPFQSFNNMKEYLDYTAKVIYGLGEFKKLVDDGKIPVVRMGKNELDNSQFGKVFGTCRIPKPVEDELVYNPDSKHVVVIYKNYFYKMPIFDKGGKLIKPEVLSKELADIIECENPKEPGPPYGLLTTDTRDNWAESYGFLMKIEGNCEAVTTVQECLFTVSLDKCYTIAPGQEDIELAAQLIHGGGSKLNSANRWMDKTIQLVANPNGIVGFCYEHSPAEGQPIAMMMDYVVRKMKEDKNFGKDGTTDGCKVEKINFQPFNPCLENLAMVAKRNIDKLARTLQIHVLKYRQYGKDFIKKQKLGPDSYVQMAIQLAFYKMHKVAGAQYESAHLRIFEGGRTETIRSCSTESINFAKAMVDKHSDDKTRAKLLRDAVNGHQAYTRLALQGKGVDRHLLGLKLMALENCQPVPKFYKSAGFVKSTHFRLSTSQVATPFEAFMCYGPITQDGYGCCYNPRECDIIFGLSSWIMDEHTDPAKFAKELDWALTRMSEVLDGPKCKL